LHEFLEVMDLFLVSATAYSSSFEVAPASTSSSISLEGSLANWIHDHYHELIEPTLQTRDRQIIETFVRFPHAVMVSALKHDNYTVFCSFGDILPIVSAWATRIPAEPGGSHEIDVQIAHELAGLDSYFICQRLDSVGIDGNEVDELSTYGKYIFVVLSTLARAALDRGDIQTYRLYLATLSGISKWQHYSWSTFDWEEMNYVDVLEVTPFRPGPRATQEQIRLIRDSHEQLANWSAMARFGLGAWTLHLQETGTLSSVQASDYLSALRPPVDLQTLYALFATLREDRAVEDAFSWHWWELNARPGPLDEPSVEPLRFSEWLTLYYAFVALPLAPERVEDAPELRPSPMSKQIAIEVEEQLQGIRQSTVWRAILVDPNEKGFEARSKVLSSMHRNAADKQRVLEQDQIIAKPLDEELVSRFSAEVQETWRRLATIRNLLKLYGRYKECPRSQARPDLTPLAVQDLMPKAGLLGLGRVRDAQALGSEQGQAIARDEDRRLSESFSELKARTATLDQFDSTLHETAQILRASNLEPIVLFNGSEVMRALHKCQRFQSRWNLQGALPNVYGMEGVCDGMFVVRVRGMREDSVAIIDLRQFGTLVQYLPNGGHPPLSITVTEISESEAEEMTDRESESPSHPGSAAAADRTARLRRLRLQARLIIEEWLELEVANPGAGRLIAFKEL
jgi:hypothetical protein